jgi:hypothetical protein
MKAQSAVLVFVASAASVACATTPSASHSPISSGSAAAARSSAGQALDHASGVVSTSAVASSDSAALCAAGLPGDDLLSWASSTVGQFRQFQYGGPTPTRPLATAFAGLPEDTAGAWCAVKVGTQTTRWFAVVQGHDPVRAIDITGPGEGTTGVQGPPVVP